ncbi:MAG: sugar transferase [Alphaproteobacteria bacterium]|uniref:Sugar transferase n=1 Tax=Candidatus Nitrobium versatile TaxID=2884831 RepID=A0A953LZ65_9BACT|nr:sugar transferase [Candidatus Nitrobium versatile]
MSNKKSGFRKTGYAKAYKTISRGFNIAFALLFLVFSLPLFVLIATAIKLTDRGPVFYRGIRLGLNKKPFVMYKFRTLVPDAERLIGAELLSPGLQLETRIGKLLRETRLDELPQLFNVLKGDMDFVGPRPERPIIYDRIGSRIRNYDVRFTVNPGLVGYSQLFTPHSTPKEIRTMIDNRFIRYKQNLMVDFLIIVYTMLVIGRKAFTKTALFIGKLVRMKVLKQYEEKRTFERVRLNNARVLISPDSNGEQTLCEAELVDINEEAFLIRTGSLLNARELFFTLQAEYRPGRRNGRKDIKRKIAHCAGQVYKEIKEGASYLYVIKYKPASPLNFYVLHQYFLDKSIA